MQIARSMALRIVSPPASSCTACGDMVLSTGAVPHGSPKSPLWIIGQHPIKTEAAGAFGIPRILKKNGRARGAGERAVKGVMRDLGVNKDNVYARYATLCPPSGQYQGVFSRCKRRHISEQEVFQLKSDGVIVLFGPLAEDWLLSIVPNRAEVEYIVTLGTPKFISSSGVSVLGSLDIRKWDPGEWIKKTVICAPDPNAAGSLYYEHMFNDFLVGLIASHPMDG